MKHNPSLASHIRELGIELYGWKYKSDLELSRCTNLRKVSIFFDETSVPPFAFLKQFSAIPITHYTSSYIDIRAIENLPPTITHLQIDCVMELSWFQFWEDIFAALRSLTHIMVDIYVNDIREVVMWVQYEHGMHEMVEAILQAAPVTLEAVICAPSLISRTSNQHLDGTNHVQARGQLHSAVKEAFERTADTRVVFVCSDPGFGATEGLVSYAAPRELFSDWFDEIDAWEMADLCLRTRAGTKDT